MEINKIKSTDYKINQKQGIRYIEKHDIDDDDNDDKEKFKIKYNPIPNKFLNKKDKFIIKSNDKKKV